LELNEKGSYDKKYPLLEGIHNENIEIVKLLNRICYSASNYFGIE